eukprot:gene27250-35987_t
MCTLGSPFNAESKKLSGPDRVARALSFYSAAVPLFVKYKALEYSIKFKRETMGENITQGEEDDLMNALHDWGFYVKTGQIISTRIDIFPKQYTTKLALTQDNLDPLPASVIKEVIRRDLLNNAELSELFLEFDDEPLGSASIAQVHKAKLLDGRIVANLKTFAKLLSDSLLIDYYKVFCEIENTLSDEVDFMREAQSTAKVAAAVSHAPNNTPRRPAVRVPLPIPGLVSRDVMVLEFVDGIALSKIAAELTRRKVDPGSPESLFLGNKILSALTDAYASMIFGSGIIHGDPHPGNIFIMEGGEVALLDCGQVKQINTKQRINLASLIIMVNQWEQLNSKLGQLKSLANTSQGNNNNEVSEVGDIIDKNELSTVERSELQEELARRTTALADAEGAGDECAAAVAILLFGNTDTILPGGYAGEEISLDSPIVQVAEFPSEFILLGRATVMIKGIANRLGLKWGLSDRWAKVALEAVHATDPMEQLPIWSVLIPTGQ